MFYTFTCSFLFLVVSTLNWKQTSCFQAATRSPLFLKSPTSTSWKTFSTTPITYLSPTRTTLSSTKDVSLSTETDTSMDKEEEEEEGIGAWIPLWPASGLTGLGPQRIRLMGVDLVVWHTTIPDKKQKKKEVHTTKFVVQLDACAHRLAPLSQGRVNPETDCIECPYHGWQFDTNGNVTSVPQLEENKSIESVQNAGGNVKNFPVHVVDDLIFVFLPSSIHGEMFPQSLLPEDMYDAMEKSEPGTEVKPMFGRTLPYSFDFLIENFMDPAHIPFAHHKLQSTRDDGVPIPISKIVSNFTHIELTFNDVSAKRARDGYASFQRPSLYHYGEFDEKDDKTGEKERASKLKLFCVPVEAGKSRIFMNSPPIKVPVFLLHAGTNRFLNSDVWLHDTEREVLKRKDAGLAGQKIAGMDYVYSSQSDLGVTLFRKWWQQHGFADSPAHTFGMATSHQLGPTALTRHEQIDPWENHAKHCSICRRSLKRMKLGKKAFLFLALASPIFGRRVPLLGIGGVAFGLFGHNFLTKLATIIEGNPERSLVADRSAAALAD